MCDPAWASSQANACEEILNFQCGSLSRVPGSDFDLITEAPRSASFAVGNETKTKPRLTIIEGNDEFVWQMSHLRFAQ
jgi:hypothetical protein